MDDLAREVLDELYGYVDTAIVPLLLKCINIRFIEDRSAIFNAKIRYFLEEDSFTIAIHDGCVELLDTAMENLNDETVNDSFDGLSKVIFGTEIHDVAIRRFVLYGALLFIILHEIAHIECGHLAFRLANSLFEDECNNSASFDETSAFKQGDGSSKHEFDPEWMKLLELEADRRAFEMLLVFGYEFLISGDEIQSLLIEIHQPDKIPIPIENAVAELALYSAAAVCFVLDVFRKEPSDYPEPQTRVLNLAYRYALKCLFGGQNVAEQTSLDAEQTEILRKQVVPAVFNAFEIGVGCRDYLRRHMRRSRAAEHVYGDESRLSQALLSLFLHDDAGGDNVTAKELRRLQRKMPKFADLLGRFRVGHLW